MLNDSMDTVFFNHFKELMVIAVINMNPDNYQACMVQRFLHHGSYLGGSSDHLASSSESLSVFDQVNRPESDSRPTAIFDDFLC